MFVVFTALVFFALAQSSGSNLLQPIEDTEEQQPLICTIECTELDI